MIDAPLDIAVIGAGPVGLSLALLAATRLPRAKVTVFDTRPADKDVSGDPRTLALSLGSVQLLQGLGAWVPERAQSILEVHVSQQPPSLPPLPAALAARLGEPALVIRAVDEAVPMLGAVLAYGAIVAPLQAAWQAAEAAEPQRLRSRFGTPVAALKNLAGGVEVDAGIAERFDLAVVAEGGVFSDQVRKAVAHDYRQTAWVGKVEFEPPARQQGGAFERGARPQGVAFEPGTRPQGVAFEPGARPQGVAFERFTRHGPAALLPLKEGGAGLVWCVASDDDPVADLTDAQRVAVLNDLFHPATGRIASISPLKHFPLGLNAERTLCDGRTVRIGNAAQTLHPVAGQGLNLGLRDAFELVRSLGRTVDVDTVLRRLEWQRGPDRWAMIAATDFLARSFTWKLPGAGAVRGLGLLGLQAIRPARALLARQMMFGSR